MFLICANLSKKGIVFRTVCVLMRKLPSVTGSIGRAAGQFWQALYPSSLPRMWASLSLTIPSEFQISCSRLFRTLPMGSSG